VPDITESTLDDLERKEAEATKAPWHMSNGIQVPGMALKLDGKQNPDQLLVVLMRNNLSQLLRSARLAAERGERIRELEAELARIKGPAPKDLDWELAEDERAP
jgi:hypothetical protein